MIHYGTQQLRISSITAVDSVQRMDKGTWNGDGPLCLHSMADCAFSRKSRIWTEDIACHAAQANTVQHWQLRNLIHVPDADDSLYFVRGGAARRLHTKSGEVCPSLIPLNVWLAWHVTAGA